MYMIYSHPSEAMVHLIKAELENSEIETVVRGEYAALVMGGGSGVDAWVELWVVDEDRIPEAQEIVRLLTAELEEPEFIEPWTCARCGTGIEPQFSACWNCGADRAVQR